MSREIASWERLGVFYLGRHVDPATHEATAEPLLYDSRDLVTHAAILGMTGSGKTGLGIDLLEEAALDRVPALVLDPKGDLANLLLTFPDLAPADFLPWVRAEDAERKGTTLEVLAASEAAKWREGLAAWGQDGERIRRLRDAADVELLTPGSEVATPVSILASFAAPLESVRGDRDLFRDRVEIAATSLLALAGIDADPLQSRDHILVSTLLAEAWQEGRSHDLASLVAEIQKPPLTRVGVLELESFYPAAERFQLALRLNNLLAAPGFDVWLRGQPLELDSMLRSPSGKPRLAVISMAHLSDAERMFFVALLLNETVAWMRAKPGTSSLRAILYMDEVFGFLPPVAEPPSKKPMLTLLKQARAYGLGLVLATQNPVDLDYKALANIGTWFLGRLQTERDKARVLDGLEGASTAAGESFDRAALDRQLSGLRSRVFLLHNVHDEEPVLFESRWAMSYLAGPIDRDGLARLAAAGRRDAAAPAPRAPDDQRPGSIGRGTEALPPRRATPARAAGGPPLLSPEIRQIFLPLRAGTGPATYAPGLLGLARAHVESARHGVAETVEIARWAPFEGGGTVDWLAAGEASVSEADLAGGPPPGASFEPLPDRAAKPASYGRWEREFRSAVARSAAVSLWWSRELAELSRPGESERDFRDRLEQRGREARDAELERARERFAARVRALDDRLRRAEAKVVEQKEQARAQKLQTAVSVGATVLGALFGRRKLSSTTVSRAATSARTASRAVKEARDIDLAEDSLAALHARRGELEREIAAELAEVSRRVERAAEVLETVTLRPRRADVEVRWVALAWRPVAARDR